MKHICGMINNTCRPGRELTNHWQEDEIELSPYTVRNGVALGGVHSKRRLVQIPANVFMTCLDHFVCIADVVTLHLCDFICA